MARINKRALTKMEIIQAASKLFLENGYSNTSIKMVCNELGMSPGNVTFYFPSKDHLLAELITLLCEFQDDAVNKSKEERPDRILSICLELATMAAICETNEIARDIFISAYTSPLCLGIIRENDAGRAKIVYKDFLPDWTYEQFVEAEILVSGIEYAVMMRAGEPIDIETRLRGALENILTLFNVPEDIRKEKLKKVFETDYIEISKHVFDSFKEYVDRATEFALQDIINC